ncbi:MAG: nucleotidyltransferase family protein [Desulfobacteraceae bacterium]|nr:nucleotidyltransferase family protein [Desulfobacteraceae bacterium]
MSCAGPIAFQKSDRQPSVGAVIPSAGFSARMGAFKPLLHLGDGTVLERSVSLFRTAGIPLSDIVVVAGHRAEAVGSVAMRLGVRCVVNTRVREGMFSSVQAGLREGTRIGQAVFVLPVDQPLIRASTISALIEARRHRPGAYWQPVFRGTEGHPPLLGPEVAAEARRASVSDTLRDVLARYRADCVSVAVADEGTVMDMDTPGAFRRGLSRLTRLGEPSEAEAIALLQDVFRVTPCTYEQGVRVARAARRVAGALGPMETDLDPVRLRTIAMLSVLLDPGGAAASEACRKMEALGFPSAAGILRRIRTCDGMGTLPMDEAQVVFLALRLGGGVGRVRTNLQREGPGADAAVERILRCMEQTASPEIRPTVREAVLATAEGG